MTPEELQENERRLNLIDRLTGADAPKVALVLKSKSENECAEIARHADQIGQRDVGALIWNFIRGNW